MRSHARIRSAASPRRQRGAIGLLGAVVLLLSVLALVLAVDTGRLMLEKRRLQQRADLAALAVAQNFCDGFSSAADALDEAVSALADNGFTAQNPTDVEVALGTTPSTARRRDFVAGGARQAAQVRVRRTVPASLIAGGLIGNDVTLQAAATAQRDLIGALSVGSRLASLDTQQSQLLRPVLGALLGTAISLDAVGYSGLANANIPLRLLRDAMGDAGVIADVGTVEDLVNAELGFGQFIGIMAQALSANGNTAAGVMQTLQTQVAAGTRAATTLQLSDILVAETGYPNTDQALGASVNALELLMASAMAVNRDSLLTVPNLSISTAGNSLLAGLLGPLLTTTLRMRVIEPPAIAIGRFGVDENNNPRTLARSAQVEASVAVNLNIVPADGGLLGGLLSLVARVEGNIGVGVTAAGGEGWLDSVQQCPTLLSRQFRFTAGANTEAAAIRVGQPTNLSTPAALKVHLAPLLMLIPVLGLDPLDVQLSANIPISGQNQQPFDFDVDLSEPDALPTAPRTVGTDLSDALTLGTLHIALSPNIRVRLLLGYVTLPLGNLVNPLNLLTGLDGVLRPILAALAQTLLEPLLQLLGVSIGEVDVRLLGVEEGHGALLI